MSPQFRGKRSEIMLCYPFEERRLPGSGWKNAWASWPVLMQPKLDGHRARAKYNSDEGRWQLWSSECNEYFSIPHINASLEDQYGSWDDIEFDGEVYIHGWTKDEIHSVVSRGGDNLHPEYEKMEFHIFDLALDGVPQKERSSLLMRMLPNDEVYAAITRLALVPFTLAGSLDKIMEVYKDFLYEEYEGIIIRDPSSPYIRTRNRGIMKYKPKKDDYYLIVGSEEGEGKHKNRLGALICQGPIGGTFNVGGGFLDSERISLWAQREELPGNYCHVEYQNLTSGKGVPRFGQHLSITPYNPEG